MNQKLKLTVRVAVESQNEDQHKANLNLLEEMFDAACAEITKVPGLTACDAVLWHVDGDVVERD